MTQAHIMADTESLGEAGVRWLEGLAAAEENLRRVRIPTITDPRGTDFAKAAFLGQTSAMLDLEQRAITAFVKLGVVMTNTCINYQTIQAPTRNEHVAFGDTGVVIYSNSICGARSNFEGGPSALAAGLTGRTPRYGFHLPQQRRATMHIRVGFTPSSLNEWGALGGVIGRIAGNYWEVPVIEGIEGAPRSDQLKHFGAAMASFGSIAMFHIVGLTPEADELGDVARDGLPSHRVTQADVHALQDPTAATIGWMSSYFRLRSSAFTNCATWPTSARACGSKFRCWLSPARRSSLTPIAWATPRGSKMPVAQSCLGCASISPTHGRLPRLRDGSGWRPTAPNWSTFWAAMAISLCWPRWKHAWMLP